MRLRNTLERYGSMQITLHWVMLLLLAAVYACIELRGYFPKGSDTREALKTWHFMLGLTVLVLAMARVVIHLFGPGPRINPVPPRWQLIASKVVHIALYAFMFGMPIVGWLLLSADAKAIPFFGVELPALTRANSDMAKQLKEVHEAVGTVGYVLIGVHAAAALIHHYVVRDNTLRRILPSWS
jgi:cytochrome b561